ncbi:protein yellow isoform X2 [Stomoxys calcitrans]|uniref:protein yellow isoform X2 n=1 Tax=Stomoxys calcitrans TaxID=35570 RepID=UPI0027E372E4|nr:protein yellow isoform X2 [Stomoxys calcitrans]
MHSIFKIKSIFMAYLFALFISHVSDSATPKPHLTIYELIYSTEENLSPGYYYDTPSISTYTSEDNPVSWEEYSVREKTMSHLPNAAKKPIPPLVRLPTNHHRQLTTVLEAKALDFSFPSEHERHSALSDGRYNPMNVLPVDVDAYSPSNGKTQIYVTIPRFDKGPPYSLARVRNPGPRHSGIQLEAYPDYSWHRSYGADCDGLTSVYRVKIDACNRMWILDSGEIGRNHTCPPQIVVFDISTHRMVHRYRLPGTVFVRNYSRLITIAVDITDPPPNGKCLKAFAYIADATSFALIVYDMIHENSWRVENRFTYPSPLFSTLTVAGESFQLLDGVFGISITPEGLGLQRMLYFHSVSNDIQASVPLHVINNATNFLIPDISACLGNFTEVGKRGIQCTVSEMSPQGYLLCGFFDPIALVGWDIRTSYTAEHRFVLAENAETLQFIGGLKIAPNAQGKLEVWILSNRAQKFFSGTNNFHEVNYRILKCGLDELLLGLPC